MSDYVFGGLSGSVMIPTSYWEYHLFVEEIGYNCPHFGLVDYFFILSFHLLLCLPYFRHPEVRFWLFHSEGYFRVLWLGWCCTS